MFLFFLPPKQTADAVKTKERCNQTMQNKGISRLLALLLAAVMLFSLASCQNADDGRQESETTEAPVTTQASETTDVQQNTVTVEIRCDDTITEDVWADAVILAETKYSFDGEVDAFTALTDVAEENDIVIVDSDGYVTGIGGLSAGDAGETSGWMFQVNGELASVGAPDYILQDGDALVWFYTADYNTYFN